MLKVRCQANATVDVKGRLSLPAQLRRSLEVNRVNSLVLCCYQGAIWGWTPEDYERSVEGRMEGMDPFAPEVVDFVHAVLAVTEEVDVDGAGRIRLPQELRELAGISKEVRVFSVLDRIEVWDAERWEQRFKSARERSPSLTGSSRSEPPRSDPPRSEAS
jgi:MraZ protein